MTLGIAMIWSVGRRVDPRMAGARAGCEVCEGGPGGGDRI